MRSLAYIVMSLILAVPAEADSNSRRDRQLECEKIKQEIREIQSKMRSGYTRAQGEKLEERLRKLRALRAKACR